MQLNYFPEAEQSPLWPAIHGLLKPAVMADEEVIAKGDVVWIAHEGGTIFAAATTRVEDETTARLRLVAGTRFKDWIGLLDATVSAWARNGGAERLTARGRKGWARFSRAFGWVALGTEDGKTIFQKELK